MEKASSDDSDSDADDDGINLRYRPFAAGEIDAPPHAIADHLIEQSDAGSPAAKYIGDMISSVAKGAKGVFGF